MLIGPPVPLCCGRFTRLRDPKTQLCVNWLRAASSRAVCIDRWVCIRARGDACEWFGSSCVALADTRLPMGGWLRAQLRRSGTEQHLSLDCWMTVHG